jgi:hypothetical protein
MTLDNVDASFFGAPRKEKREKSRKERHSSQRQAPGLGACVEFVNRLVQLTASA